MLQLWRHFVISRLFIFQAPSIPFALSLFQALPIGTAESLLIDSIFCAL